MIGTILRWYRNLKQRFVLGKNVGSGEYILSTGRDSVRYTRADHSVEVQVELQGGKTNYAIYSGTAKYWSPSYDLEPVTEAERQAIVRAIGRYLDQSARTYEVK